jgi:hypothetical protein
MKLLLAFATSVAILATAPYAVAQNAACKVDMAGYKSLSNGMSYSQVVANLGCEGSEIANTGSGKFTTVMYTWKGYGSVGANMNIMIQGGKLLMKAQYGLQ